MPRDYLEEEASSVIFRNRVSLAKLVESDHHQVVGNLLYAIEKSRGEMHAMIRKAAAYALGQIGEPKSMKQLREYYDLESARAYKMQCVRQ
jgi:HEAT repeat protein